jgi:Uma2 family endonuclease
MSSPAQKGVHKFTYADYRTWPDEERWEIINGEAYDMTPAPSVKHQRIATRLARTFGNLLDKKPCEPFAPPTDVVLDEFNIVQPDFLVVCDKGKITAANIQGAPDLVVEILSPSTGRKDRREKKALYERFGVREYLLIHPEDEIVERYSLVEGKYVGPDVFGWDETMRLFAFSDMALQLWELFGRELLQPDVVAVKEQ